MSTGDWEVSPVVVFNGDRLTFKGMLGIGLFRKAKLRTIALALESAQNTDDAFCFSSSELFAQGIVSVSVLRGDAGTNFSVHVSTKCPTVFLRYERWAFAFVDTEAAPEDILLQRGAPVTSIDHLE